MLENEFNHGFSRLKVQWPKSYNDYQKDLAQRAVDKSGISPNGWLTVVDWLLGKCKSAPTPFDIGKTCRQYYAKHRRQVQEIKEPKVKICGDCLNSGLLEVRVEERILFCKCHSCGLGKKVKWDLPIYNQGTGLVAIIGAKEFNKRWTPPTRKEQTHLIGSDTVDKWLDQVRESEQYWRTA